jgi:hypothetical protein
MQLLVNAYNASLNTTRIFWLIYYIKSDLNHIFEELGKELSINIERFVSMKELMDILAPHFM